MNDAPRTTHPLFARGSWAETSRIVAVLRLETLGGALLLGATVLAVVGANSAWSGGHTRLTMFTLGPHVGLRDRIYRRVCADDARDGDRDGVPDVWLS